MAKINSRQGSSVFCVSAPSSIAFGPLLLASANRPPIWVQDRMLWSPLSCHVMSWHVIWGRPNNSSDNYAIWPDIHNDAVDEEKSSSKKKVGKVCALQNKAIHNVIGCGLISMEKNQDAPEISWVCGRQIKPMFSAIGLEGENASRLRPQHEAKFLRPNKEEQPKWCSENIF